MRLFCFVECEFYLVVNCDLILLDLQISFPLNEVVFVDFNRKFQLKVIFPVGFDRVFFS